jgi:hypothetical protein
MENKQYGVNARYNGSIMAKITLHTSPYNIFLNNSNGHGCYFFKYFYFNLWIIYVQWPTNLPKSMWKLVFKVVDVILKFGSPKKKPHKVQRNNGPSNIFKNTCFWTKKIEKQTKITIHMDLWKYGQILTIQKTSLTIKWLRFSKKRFLIWVYHLVLHYIYWVPKTNLKNESI